MKHRPTGYILNTMRNEVPGGVELASDAAKCPQTLRVTDTQFKFLAKFDLLSYHGALVTLAGTSIIVENSTDA